METGDLWGARLDDVRRRCRRLKKCRIKTVNPERGYEPGAYIVDIDGERVYLIYTRKNRVIYVEKMHPP